MLNRRMPNGTYGGVRGGLNSPYSIACDMRKQSRAYLCGKRGGKLMKRRELISTGMYTQKQADLNMEQCAEFMARMIQKYGAEILEELESEKTRITDENQT